jgi:hypothetical protein
MEKYGFVYIWRDRKHNRYYIGSHWGTEDDAYVCSSPWMSQAYKHRPNDFKRRILEKVYSNKKQLLESEFKWISLIKESEIKSKYYNLNIKATGHWSAYPENVKTIKDKISHGTKQAMAKPENRERYLEGLKNRNQVQTDETKRKRSDAMIKTMAEKFPNRKQRAKRGTPEYSALQSELAKRRWAKQKINTMHNILG